MPQEQPTEDHPQTLPLDGIRVLDLSNESAVFATRCLADLGAEVIMVEPPEGSPVRRLAPFLGAEPCPEGSLYHLYHNANKRSVTADIAREEGAGLVGRLARTAEVFVETFRPGYLAGLGLGYEDLKALNPGLIYVSVTPFGQNGEWRDRAANDLVAGAASGLLYVSGEPEDQPVQGGADPAYKMASLAAATGVMLAITGRDLDPDGEGAHLDISLQEAANLSVLQTSNPTIYAWEGRVPERPGLSIAYICADGKWAGLNVRPDHFSEILEWFDEAGIEHNLKPEDWPKAQTGGVTPEVEVLLLARQLAAGLPRDEFVEKAQQHGMLSLPILRLSEMEEVEHLAVNEQFIEVEHEPLDASLGFVRSPVDGIDAEIPLRRAPLLGEHNREVWGSLGLSETDIARLIDEGVL